MYNPKKFKTDTFLIDGIILGMLVLKTHAPKNINNHTESANTITNIIICPVDKLDMSLGSTLVKACFCEGVIEATVLAKAETKEVIILNSFFIYY